MLSGRDFAQAFPFCWWGAIVIDHFSRKVIGFAVFESLPDSEEIIKVLNKAIKRSGKKPKHIITDKGTQFYPSNAKDENKGKHPFFKWCKRKGIKRRTGAVGKFGSVAIIERFMKSLKNECARMIIVPLNMSKLRHEINLYITWYNQFRTHEYLKGRTPQEVYSNVPPGKRLEFKRPSKIPEFDVKISFLEGRKHLPIIELEKVA
jgi:transposase InsO family protein